MDTSTNETVGEENQPEEQPSILELRYGKEVLKRGYTCGPNLLYDYEEYLYLTSTQGQIIKFLMRYWIRRYPSPAISTLAKHLRKGERCIQVNIRKMARELRDEEGNLLRPPIIEIAERFNDKGEQITNAYNLAPLFTYLLEVDARVNPKKDQGDSVQSTGVNLEVTTGVNLDRGESREQKRGESKERTGVNPKTPFEDSNKEGFSRQDNPSNLRKEPKKGTVLESTYPHVDNFQTDENPNNQNGNASYNKPNEDRTLKPSNQLTPQHPDHETQNRNNRNGTEYEKPGAQQASWQSYEPSAPRRKKHKLPHYLDSFARDFSREFHDENPASSRTRLANLYAESIVTPAQFGKIMDEAKDLTRKARVQKTTSRPDETGRIRTNRMPYFFKVLRDLLLEGNWLRVPEEVHTP